jgi:hypothetical protein
MNKVAEAELTTLELNQLNPHKVVYCVISVDGDLRVGSLDQQKQGVHAMRQAHASLGILGQTSWLINEHDFHWTVLHPELLLELVESCECIGIHDHLDTHYLEDKPFDQIFEFLLLSRNAIHNFYKHSGLDIPILVHRNGCAQQGRQIYQALEKLEYTILSDVRPGMKWCSRMVPIEHPIQHWKSLENGDPESIFTDNSRVPMNALPWRHNADNWLDIDSQIGYFLQAPITCLPWVDEERVHSAVANSGQQVFLVIDTHPYNLQDPETGDVSAGLVNAYSNSLDWIRDTYGAIFIRMDQISKLITFQPENNTQE